MLQPAHTVAIEELAERANDIAAEMRAGHRLELIQGGRRIGEIIPNPAGPEEADREQAWERVKRRMKEGLDLGGLRIENRDELYDRD